LKLAKIECAVHKGASKPI